MTRVSLRIVDVADFVMNMTHEDVGNDVGRETVNNLVEQIRSVKKSASSVPTC